MSLENAKFMEKSSELPGVARLEFSVETWVALPREVLNPSGLMGIEQSAAARRR